MNLIDNMKIFVISQEADSGSEDIEVPVEISGRDNKTEITLVTADQVATAEQTNEGVGTTKTGDTGPAEYANVSLQLKIGIHMN